jgi:hypothetical protein
MEHVVTKSDSYLAMAEVCTWRRERAVAIVLVEPTAIADAAELVDTARVFAPAVPIWWYSTATGLSKVMAHERSPWLAVADGPDRSGPRLAEADTDVKPGGSVAFRAAKGQKSANEAPRVVVRAGGGIGIRRLRLVGEGPVAAPAPAESASESPGKGPLLTEEELKMLLGDDTPGSANGSGSGR